MNMNGMIMAAGFGSRFRPHTNILAKPALPFLNIPLLYYSLDIAQSLNPEKIIINTHHLPETVNQVVSNYPSFSGNNSLLLKTSFEKKILGNAGGMKNNQKELKDDHFFVLNADTVIIPENPEFLLEAVEFHKKKNALMTLVVMEHTSPENANLYGSVWSDQSNNVLGTGKKSPTTNSKGFHFYGARIFSPRIFDYIPEGESDIFRDILPKTLDAGEKVKTFISPATFYDGGNLKTYLHDSAHALQNLDRLPYLQKFLKKSNPVKISSNKLIGQNVNVHPSAKLEGLCVLGDGVEIEKNAYLKDVVADNDITISTEKKITDELVLSIT